MPLSDHEQRLLEQMERALYEDDPKFASSLRSGNGGSLNRVRIAVGALGVLLGLVVVVIGVAVALPWIGVLGFAGMVAGAFWAWTGTRSEQALGAPGATPAGVAGAGAKRKGGQTAFMNRMEDRWRKRKDGDSSL